VNCNRAHGGEPFYATDSRNWQVPTMEACTERCSATPYCGGVTVSNDGPPFLCYFRRSVDLPRCERSSKFMSYEVYAPPAPPHFPPARCDPKCTKNRISDEVLPMLSANNSETEVEWHSYLKKVYHQGIGKRTIDTTRFTWFFSERKFAVVDSRPCGRICRLSISQGPKYDGTAWIGTEGPEGPQQLGAYGFFVHRPFLTISEAHNCERIEVFHVAARWLGPEWDGSWFFHAAGSGIFLDCVELRRRGRIIVAKDRNSPGAPDYPSFRERPAWMHENGVSMIIYTEANFEQHRNPRTEIVVRHAQRGHSEYDYARGPCLDPPAIDVPLRTGFEGSIPCVCIPQHDALTFSGDGRDGFVDSTNCDGTPYSDD
jgi:hypothetical protein